MGHILPDPNMLSSVRFVHVVGSDGPDTISRLAVQSCSAQRSRCFKGGRWEIISMDFIDTVQTPCKDDAYKEVWESD